MKKVKLFLLALFILFLYREIDSQDDLSGLTIMRVSALPYYHSTPPFLPGVNFLIEKNEHHSDYYRPPYK